MGNTIETINKTFDQKIQVMQVARTPTTVPTKNDDQYIWMLMKNVIYFEIIVCENQTLCIMCWT